MWEVLSDGKDLTQLFLVLDDNQVRSKQDYRIDQSSGVTDEMGLCEVECEGGSEGNRTHQ